MYYCIGKVHLTNSFCVHFQQQQRIWTCLEYCVTKRTGLLKNRHLDQVQIHVMIFKYARSVEKGKKTV